MFIGEYQHSIDQKGRIAVPVKFRSTLKSGAVLTKGLDGCLFLFPKATWRKISGSISSLPMSKASARSYARLILAGATEMEFDAQGRILIPANLKNYAQLGQRAVIAGLNNRLEIWSKSKWEGTLERIEPNAGKIAEELADMKI